VKQARLNAIVVVSVLGAAAGAANAWLCLSRIPEPVHDNPSFGWLTVPAGALHGAMLAVIPVAAHFAVFGWRLVSRCALAIPVGWLAGYLSWIPLHRWVIDEPWRKSLLWPFEGDSGLGVAWSPFAYFGIVSGLYFLCLSIFARRRSWAVQVACATGAGVLGSLWFWSEFQPWYFAAIHGTIWGVLVGGAASVMSEVMAAGERGVA
jgi:hypothetical protein